MTGSCHFAIFLVFIYVPIVFPTRVTLTHNGYNNVVVAINPNIPEDPNLIKSLKVSQIPFSMMDYNYLNVGDMLIATRGFCSKLPKVYLKLQENEHFFG